MGDAIKVDTPEQLGKLLGDMKSEIDATAASVKIIEEIKAAQEALTKENQDLLAKLQGLTIAAKAKGSWKAERTPEAHAYGIGKMVGMMLEAKRGVRKAHRDLVEVGCVPTVKRAGAEGWTGADGNPVREKALNREKVIMGDDIREKGGLSSSPLTGDDSVGAYYGSYTIPVEYRAELDRVALDNSAMMGLVTRVPVPGITSYLPTTSDELAFTMVTNEDTDKTADTLTFGRTTLTTQTYAAYIAIVEEFFEDTLIQIGAVVRDMFGEAWGKKFDTLCLSDSTYGAINTSGVTGVDMDAGDAAFSNLTSAYLDAMIAALTTQTKRIGARFFMHVTNWDNIRIQKNAQGDYLFGPPNNDIDQRARGYPVVLTDGMPALTDTAASTPFVAFGNPRRIWNGERVGFEFRIYDQTQSAMESGQIFLRVRTRQAFATSLPANFVILTTAA